MKHYNRGTHKYETRNELNNELYTYWWDYYSNDDVNDFRYYEDPWGVHYEYVNDIDEEISYIKRGLIRHRHIRNKGTLQIDMMSIYSKEMLRQKKIEMILGDIQDLTNTIQNILLSKGIHL
jgi:hypothetical protein